MNDFNYFATPASVIKEHVFSQRNKGNNEINLAFFVKLNKNVSEEQTVSKMILQKKEEAFLLGL